MKNNIEIIQEKVRFFEKKIKNETLFSYVTEENRKGNDIVFTFLSFVFLSEWCEFDEGIEQDLESSLLSVLECVTEKALFHSFMSSLEEDNIKTFLENCDYFPESLKKFIESSLKWKKLENFDNFLVKECVIKLTEDEEFFFEEEGQFSESINFFVESLHYKRKKDDFYTCEDCKILLDNYQCDIEIYCFNEEFYCRNCTLKIENIEKALGGIALSIQHPDGRRVSSYEDTSFFAYNSGIFSLILEVFEEYEEMKKLLELIKK